MQGLRAAIVSSPHVALLPDKQEQGKEGQEDGHDQGQGATTVLTM